MYSILPEGTVHMYFDITGRGLCFQKITGCMCMCTCMCVCVCTHVGVRERVKQTAFQKSICKGRNRLLNKIQTMQDL